MVVWLDWSQSVRLLQGAVVTFIIALLFLVCVYFALRNFLWAVVGGMGTILLIAYFVQPFPNGVGPVILLGAGIGLCFDVLQSKN